jgi:hypothetical protein
MYKNIFLIGLKVPEFYILMDKLTHLHIMG